MDFSVETYNKHFQKDDWKRWCDTATNNKKDKSAPAPVNYDFPEPIFDDESDEGWDILTYLHKAAEYERWAERARCCGKDDLAILYEIKAEEWFSVYKEWEKGF